MPKFIGTPVTGQNASTNAVLPKSAARGRPEFRLVHNPAKWYWEPQRARFLPRLDRLSLDPGINGVDWDDRARKPMPEMAKAKLMQAGMTILEVTDPRLPHSYLMTWPAEDGVKVYGLFCETPRLVSGRAVRWDTDTDAWLDFLCALVDAGLVPAMEPHVATDTRADLQARYERRQKRYSVAPGGHLRMQALEPMAQALDAWRAEERRFQDERTAERTKVKKPPPSKKTGGDGQQPQA